LYTVEVWESRNVICFACFFVLSSFRCHKILAKYPRLMVCFPTVVTFQGGTGIMPDITVMLGDSEVGKYHLDGSEISIGRAEGNDVRINNLSVSRRHAKILKEGSIYSLIDLDSSNGTYVNGDRAEHTRLADGDQIGIGKHVLVFKIADSGAVDMYPSDYQDTICMPKSQATPALRVFAPGQREAIVAMSGNSLRIGRGSANDVQLTDWFVEMAQAEIRREGPLFRLVDLSPNKTTLLNDMPVKEDAWLNEGDIIQVGVSRLVFSVQGGQEITGEFRASATDTSAPPLPSASDFSLADAPPVDRPLPGTGIVPMEDLVGHREYTPTSGPEVGMEDEPSQPESIEPSVEEPEHLALDVPNYSPEGYAPEKYAPEEPADSGPVHAEAESSISQDSSCGQEDAGDHRAIAVWERALQNKSVLIRQQAAERLKKITGRDYDY
jgi:pSer/pThr/pTyr-binding forkhead associated (FHA) protein